MATETVQGDGVVFTVHPLTVPLLDDHFDELLAMFGAMADTDIKALATADGFDAVLAVLTKPVRTKIREIVGKGCCSPSIYGCLPAQPHWVLAEVLAAWIRVSFMDPDAGKKWMAVFQTMASRSIGRPANVSPPQSSVSAALASSIEASMTELAATGTLVPAGRGPNSTNAATPSPA